MGWKAEFKGLAGAIVVPILFFWRELLGLSVFAGFDFTHLILPFHQFARESLAHGVLPHWNPYIFAGFPQISEGEGGLFYPGNLLMWLPGDQAVLMSWTVVLHLILTGCLMYAFLRGRGASRAAAGWMAVFYQLIPGLILRFETVGLFQAVAWIPGFYWACEQAVSNGAGGRWSKWLMWTLFAAVQIAFMLLAGSSQIAFYTMVGAVFFLGGVAAMGPRQRIRAVCAAGTFLISAGLGICLAAVQLMPTSMLAALSYRLMDADIGFYRMGTWLSLSRLASLFMFPAVKQPGDLLDYISSLGYVGLLLFILGGMTLSLHRRHMNPILPPFFLGFFGLILAFGFNFSTWHDLITFPVFSLFRALGRMILPTQVALVALAAVGLDALFKQNWDEIERKRLVSGAWWSMVVAAGLVVWLVVNEGLPLSGLQTIGLILLGAMALIVAIGLVGYFRTGKPSWLIGLLAVWFLIHFVGLIPMKSAITVSRSSFNQIREAMTLENSLIPENPSRPLRVIVASEDDVWDPLLGRLSKAPFSSGNDLPIPALGNELALGGVGVLNGYTPLIPWRWQEVAQGYVAKGITEVEEASPRLRRVLAITTTDALIVPDSFKGGEGFEEVDVDLTGLYPADWHMVATPEVVPYASIPRYVEGWMASAWDAYKHWIVLDCVEPGEWVVVEPTEQTKLPEGMEWGEIQAPITELGISPPAFGGMMLDDSVQREVVSVTRQNNGVKIVVHAGVPCWLVVRESYLPGWEVWVDDIPSNVVPADYLFCAVPIPEGEHTVWMQYETPGLRFGMMFSSAGWGVWLIGMIVAVIAERRRTGAKA